MTLVEFAVTCLKLKLSVMEKQWLEGLEKRENERKQIITEKRCCSCKEKFPLSDVFFYRSKQSSDGLQGICKVCANNYAKQYYKDHKIKRPIPS